MHTVRYAILQHDGMRQEEILSLDIIYSIVLYPIEYYQKRYGLIFPKNVNFPAFILLFLNLKI